MFIKCFFCFCFGKTVGGLNIYHVIMFFPLKENKIGEKIHINLRLTLSCTYAAKRVQMCVEIITVFMGEILY